MVKSGVEIMAVGIVSTVFSDVANSQHVISSTIADYGVIAGIIIGGLGVIIKALEVGSGFWLKWLERQDGLKAQKKKNKKQ